nr:MAG TPA: hypothetical protein [Bacteriophage sp.]DAM85922.1 MAG TPA: hypothetical protein [Caudoviricetes sp.]
MTAIPQLGENKRKNMTKYKPQGRSIPVSALA